MMIRPTGWYDSSPRVPERSREHARAVDDDVAVDRRALFAYGIEQVVQVLVVRDRLGMDAGGVGVLAR